MKLPLETRNIKPHKDAEKLGNTYRADGLQDGVHTGGVYRWQSEIWKPLDGRPYMNADFVCPTLEAEFLEAMQDLASFPKNWRVEIANGRKWLVRPEVMVLSEKDCQHLSRDVVLQIEQDVMECNRRGWEVNDAFQVAFDRNTYQYFILDCSSAQKMSGKGAYAANEFDRIMRFFKLCGLDSLVELRQNARHLLSPLEFCDKHPEAMNGDYKHVYASFNRPFSLMWASLGQDCILEHQKRDGNRVPHTWIVTQEPLPDDKVFAYELTWAYSKLR